VNSGMIRIGPQEAWRDDKRLEIYTAGLEFELGRAPLVRAWDSRVLLAHLGSQSMLFGVGFSRIKKKKSYERIGIIKFPF